MSIKKTTQVVGNGKETDAGKEIARQMERIIAVRNNNDIGRKPK